jgi:hypothetical protein
MDRTPQMTPNMNERVNMGYEHTPNINHERYGSQQIGYGEEGQEDRPQYIDRGN